MMKIDAKLSITCSLWFAVALSGASTASARALTTQEGNYAVVTNWSTPVARLACLDELSLGYQQNIVFSCVQCNTGNRCLGGESPQFIAEVESAYTVGRAIAVRVAECEGAFVYELGSCNC